MKKRVTCRTPGKIMLAGEYHVLQGGRALATTVDHFLTVHLEEELPTPAFKSSSEETESVPPEILESELPNLTASTKGFSTF